LQDFLSAWGHGDYPLAAMPTMNATVIGVPSFPATAAAVARTGSPSMADAGSVAIKLRCLLRFAALYRNDQTRPVPLSLLCHTSWVVFDSCHLPPIPVSQS
jgi:hypothetical protein